MAQVIRHCVATKLIALKNKHFKTEAVLCRQIHHPAYRFSAVADSFYDAFNLMASLISLVFAVLFEKCNLACFLFILIRLGMPTNQRTPIKTHLPISTRKKKTNK